MNKINTQTPIYQGNVRPDLSLCPATIEFMDRVFGAHGGYTPDVKISQVLQTGGFLDKSRYPDIQQ